MPKKHKYYVYHDGETVFARMDDLEPVILEKCETPQAAYGRVQSIINPENHRHDEYGEKGFNAEAFQSAISRHCETAVKAAYAQKAAKGRK